MKKVIYSLTIISLFIGLTSKDVFALGNEEVLVPSIKSEGPSTLVLQNTQASWSFLREYILWANRYPYLQPV